MKKKKKSVYQLFFLFNSHLPSYSIGITMQSQFSNGPWGHSMKGVLRGQIMKKLQFARPYLHQVLIQREELRPL